jgi:ribosomal protein S18 acetylase RimI-like enzyme
MLRQIQPRAERGDRLRHPDPPAILPSHWSSFTVERVTPREAADAVSFLVAEGHDLLPGFDAREWWTRLADDTDTGPRVLYGARNSRAGDWLGVIAGQTHPGRLGFVWPPVVRKAVFSDEVALRLLATLCDGFVQQRTQVVQTVLEQVTLADGGDALVFPSAESTECDRLFLEAGFEHEVWLESLELPLGGRGSPGSRTTFPARASGYTGSGMPPLRNQNDSAPLDWLLFNEARRSLFEEVAARTLMDSADCRFLAGRRTGADLIAAHEGCGKIDPDLWRLALLKGTPVGVLLLRSEGDANGADATAGTGDISYMGIVPEFRGQGLGGRLVEEAATVGRRRGWSSLGAVMDATNHYAKEVYRTSGGVVRERLRGRVRVF